MAPTIDDRRIYDVKLSPADVKAIQRLYGLKTGGPSVSTTAPTTSSNMMSTSLPGFWDRLLPRMPDRDNEVETQAVMWLMDYHTTFHYRLRKPLPDKRHFAKRENLEQLCQEGKLLM